MQTVVDHLVYGVTNLDEYIDWFETKTGVRPAIGGAHEGLGTHNALVSLGECYLELIAPDPNQPDPGRPRAFGLDTLTEPRLITFAVRPTGDQSILEAADAARTTGWDPGEVLDVSRLQPNGERIAWKLTFPPDPEAAHNGAVPFLIDWGEAANPATTTPTGCVLDDLMVATPAAADVSAIYRALGLAVPVMERPTARLSAALSTPNGPLLLR